MLQARSSLWCYYQVFWTFYVKSSRKLFSLTANFELSFSKQPTASMIATFLISRMHEKLFEIVLQKRWTAIDFFDTPEKVLRKKVQSTELLKCSIDFPENFLTCQMIQHDQRELCCERKGKLDLTSKWAESRIKQPTGFSCHNCRCLRNGNGRKISNHGDKWEQNWE